MTNDTNGCPDPRIPDEEIALDELAMRVRTLEAERLRPIPKLFTSRAQDSEYNALTRGYERDLSTSASTCDSQGKQPTLAASDTQSDIAARWAALQELDDEEAD